MFDYLKDHAVKNVWCSPEQDNQVILSAQRITRPGGELLSFPIMTRRVSLPEKDRRFHVYQIGQAHPSVLGLLPRKPEWASGVWKRFSDSVDTLPLFCDLYTDAGVHLPLYRSYYMFTNDRALIFAIDISSKSPIDYEQDRIYLRLYTNAYFESTQASSLSTLTRCEGRSIKNNDDILALQAKVVQYRQLAGQVFCYVNGHLVPAIDFMTAKIGDDVEYIYDASVKRVVDLAVRDLPAFTSTLDQVYKFLLHYPSNGSEQIDFIDDVDVYVLHKEGEKYTGRYFHRNVAKALRMVTHRDYSLSADHFLTLAEHLSAYLSDTPIDLQSLTIRLYIRKSGLTRPLVFDHQRIFELYKLDDASIVKAMVGVDSTMPYWTADALENSYYTKLMRVGYKDIDINLIESAYGYNAISKIIGDTPVLTEVSNGQNYVRLPIGLYENSTLYEYDADGVLLGSFTHEIGTIHMTRNPAAVLVEGIVGYGSDTPSVTTGTDQIPINPVFSHRVYMCYLVDGVPNLAWKDITGSEHYRIENNVLLWNNLESDQWLMVRTDERFLAYTFDLTGVAGTFYFDLYEIVDGQKQRLSVPMGDLDIWLNGKSLIENLGYVVDFPRVTIFNKSYLKQPAMYEPQTITVRFTGFCDEALKSKRPEEYGFVEHGVLSNNRRYDVKDDKVLRITVQGGVKHRSVLKFSEETLGVSIVNVLNGAPYQIKEVIVPLRTLAYDETYMLRLQSKIVDQAVEDYLTLKIPQPERPAVSAIANRHALYSPFFSHIVNDLFTRQFEGDLDRTLDNNDVIALCQPYEHLLKADPLNEDIGITQRFVVIHPTQSMTPIGLSLSAYRFIQKVNELYGRGLVQLSPHLNVSLGG